MNLFRGGGLKLGNLVTKEISLSNDDLCKDCDISIPLMNKKGMIYSAYIYWKYGSRTDSSVKHIMSLDDQSGYTIEAELYGSTSGNAGSWDAFSIYGPGFLSDAKSISDCLPQRTGSTTDGFTGSTIDKTMHIYIGKLSRNCATILTKNIFDNLFFNIKNMSKTGDMNDSLEMKFSYFPILE